MRRLSDNAIESEKAIERYLVGKVAAAGGLCLKYYNPAAAGYPDRLCILPLGVTFWVEVKSKGRRLSRLQAVRIQELLSRGCKVFVASSPEDVDNITNLFAITQN